MRYYLAPMESITGYVFRNTFHKHFPMDLTYVSPFIASRELSSREKNDVIPEHNEGIHLIPQILTNHADEFIYIAKKLQREYGYSEVNLNLGCPSGTVVPKKRGAGFLQDLVLLDHFLDEIFSSLDMKVSIKTRIGFSNPSEWDAILDVYKKYPISELMIHLRTREEMYEGEVHLDAFLKAKEELSIPLVFNGNIDSVKRMDELKSEIPNLSSVMIGRGILKDPGLFYQLEDPSYHLSESKMLSFVSDLCDFYSEVLSGDKNVMFKMKELWFYMSSHYEEKEKLLKKIRKVNKLSEFKEVLNSASMYHFKEERA